VNNLELKKKEEQERGDMPGPRLSLSPKTARHPKILIPGILPAKSLESIF
jgi:hypothetical protein